MALLALYNLPGQVQVASRHRCRKCQTRDVDDGELEIKLFEASDAPQGGFVLSDRDVGARCFSSLDRCRGVQERSSSAFQGGEWRVLIDDDGGGYLASRYVT